MPRAPNPVDRAQRLLRTLGWSYGDMWANGVWKVYAHRDGQHIVTHARLKSEAWDEALRHAGTVQRESQGLNRANIFDPSR